MKKFTFMAMLVSVFSFADTQNPLIVKSSGGGFTHPELGGYEKCEIFSDKVTITHQVGHTQETGLKVLETRAVSLTGNVQNVINNAKAEEIKLKDNFLCDGPSTSIQALSEDGEKVLLFSTGGCGTPEKERRGYNSQKLVQIADIYCEKTYKFARSAD